MFESKHCSNCFFAATPKIRSFNSPYKWCALKGYETSISNCCCHFKEAMKEEVVNGKR